MANLETFDEIIEVVLEHEGGYVDDPDDRGGATNWGVTQAVYENFVGYKCDKEEIKNMDEETAKEIYHEKFWKPSRADKLPAEVRETYFDMVVNHGQGGAVKILKNWELQVERSGYYWNLVFKGSKYTQRTSQVKFIRGWIRRCFKL